MKMGETFFFCKKDGINFDKGIHMPFLLLSLVLAIKNTYIIKYFNKY